MSGHIPLGILLQITGSIPCNHDFVELDQMLRLATAMGIVASEVRMCRLPIHYPLVYAINDR
jgi:hypothetical protein